MDPQTRAFHAKTTAALAWMDAVSAYWAEVERANPRAAAVARKLWKEQHPFSYSDPNWLHFTFQGAPAQLPLGNGFGTENSLPVEHALTHTKPGWAHFLVAAEQAIRAVEGETV